jgi:predicted nucleic acid-binding protein
MSVLVVDASVAAKLFTDENFSEDAFSILDEHNDLHAPDFLFLEMDNVIWKWIRRGAMTETEAGEIRSAMKLMPIKSHAFKNLLDSAFVIANQTQQSVYDCLYVALAVFLNGRMVTADSRLYQALAGGPYEEHMIWIEDVRKSGKNGLE